MYIYNVKFDSLIVAGQIRSRGGGSKSSAKRPQAPTHKDGCMFSQ